MGLVMTNSEFKVKLKDFENKITTITGISPIKTMTDAEPVGPKNMIDVLVVAPCTGNTLSKLANAISDTPVTMVAKSLMRNNKPIVYRHALFA